MPSRWTADRLRKEAERQRREAAEAKRVRELQELALREAQVWRDVYALIEEKKTRPYDEAVELLLKLRELAKYQDRLPAFQARLAELQGQYASRPGLLRRLQRARLI